ncbi:hypothetical protein BJ875DRAFT_481888 [Amylocarpus encephaloides]|uniref:Uncharacterized protein n=1 Tax=Amylocarpus encephaloides TaxID=45428 RepID=A0A9P7YP77_9HELO|nr:hypothetical protein BJ875DRAFT_481888 [Amylocarpus encephaloides]
MTSTPGPPRFFEWPHQGQNAKLNTILNGGPTTLRIKCLGLDTGLSNNITNSLRTEPKVLFDILKLLLTINFDGIKPNCILLQNLSNHISNYVLKVKGEEPTLKNMLSNRYIHYTIMMWRSTEENSWPPKSGTNFIWVHPYLQGGSLISKETAKIRNEEVHEDPNIDENGIQYGYMLIDKSTPGFYEKLEKQWISGMELRVNPAMLPVHQPL